MHAEQSADFGTGLFLFLIFAFETGVVLPVPENREFKSPFFLFFFKANADDNSIAILWKTNIRQSVISQFQSLIWNHPLKQWLKTLIVEVNVSF